MKGRQLSKNELLRLCKQVAYEKRITKSSSWFSCQVMSSYTLWKNENYGAVRISRVLNAINEKEIAFHKGEIDLDEIRNRLDQKYHLKFSFEEEQVRTRSKDKVATFINKKSLENDNAIALITERFIVLLLDTLTEDGYGEKRLGRVQDNMFALINTCTEKGKIFELHTELKDYAGIELEKPKDYMRGVS